ncbi:hypothetical protein SAMN05519104_5185 [Rhizobiales bacterium GAS188]|nr:hypothetical protein SAMN05519104_5185 [Rhizobiales bacterium GAS188]
MDDAAKFREAVAVLGVATLRISHTFGRFAQLFDELQTMPIEKIDTSIPAPSIENLARQMTKAAMEMNLTSDQVVAFEGGIRLALRPPTDLRQ